MNNTLNLQGERLGLFNPITGLDNKSFAKVKKNVKRLIHDLQRGKMESDSKKRSTSNLCLKHKKNIGINTADKFVNGILTNDRNKKVR